jgi:hypothetical protein
MKIRNLIPGLIFLFFFYSTAYSQEAQYLDYKISGPYSFKNMSIFLMQGESNIDASNIMTLSEALEQKKIIVHETGNVGTLAVENISTSPVYIQSGDIVKGGKQDRMFKTDIIIKPESGKVPIHSFCVEQNRWSKRGDESNIQFSSSEKQIVSKELKLAAKSSESQGEVWAEVANVQEKLSRKLNKFVKNASSASSLQLTLEDRDIENLTVEYIDYFAKIIREEKNIIGFACAINGEFNSSDLYGSTILFEKLYPKILESWATEALSIYESNRDYENLTALDLKLWLEDSDNSGVETKEEKDNNEYKVRESEKDIAFETYDKTNPEQWIHKNVIKK